MKSGIHPKVHSKAKVICACGATFNIPGTEEEIHTEICSACHPFYTGKMKMVDSAGMVEKFNAKRDKAAKLAEDNK